MNEIDRKHSDARCAICGKATEHAFKPFCSKRCADIDLNRWLSLYAVPMKDEDASARRTMTRGKNHDRGACRRRALTDCSRRSSAPTCEQWIKEDKGVKCEPSDYQITT